MPAGGYRLVLPPGWLRFAVRGRPVPASFVVKDVVLRDLGDPTADAGSHPSSEPASGLAAVGRSCHHFLRRERADSLTSIRATYASGYAAAATLLHET